MLFTPGIIPNFLLVKELGLLDTYASLILPALISAFNLVVLRAFFMGCRRSCTSSGDRRRGRRTILVRIVLPLSKAVLAVVGLFYAVAYWNAFFNAMLYLRHDKWPLPLVLRTYVLTRARSAAPWRRGEALPRSRPCRWRSW